MAAMYLMEGPDRYRPGDEEGSNDQVSRRLFWSPLEMDHCHVQRGVLGVDVCGLRLPALDDFGESISLEVVADSTKLGSSETATSRLDNSATKLLTGELNSVRHQAVIGAVRVRGVKNERCRETQHHGHRHSCAA